MEPVGARNPVGRALGPRRLAIVLAGLVALTGAILIASGLLPSCFTNNPYPRADDEEDVFYTTFHEEPKYLDPARSYSSDEYGILQQIYEPPLQYHYLKRPYELIPLTTVRVPTPRYFDAAGGELEASAPPEEVARAVYELRIRPGIRYQDHPCFARRPDGTYRWHLGAGGEFPPINHPAELAAELGETGSRELRAEDYAYQMKRLAHPLLQCPVFPILARYVEGYGEFYAGLADRIASVRAERRKAAGAFYSQERDEDTNPIWLDLRKYDFPGVEVVDELTLRIVLKRKYPQLRYWLAMPFFSPIPWEADRFYTQAAAVKQDITLSRFPVGTGPFSLTFSQSNWRIILSRNPNFEGREVYPTEGEPRDEEDGLLDDAGEPLPFLDRIVHVMEKESIPCWNKFLQGYYDHSGVLEAVFDQAVNVTAHGSELTDFLIEKNIRLATAVSPTTYYYAFNMLDDVVGGLDEKRRKLRQAISIAFDIEENIQIFRNERGIPAQGPIPPGITGHMSGPEGVNSVVYEWDEDVGEPRRRGVEEARRLLAEAGYPGGVGPEGRPLVLYFDTTVGGAGDKARLDWMRKQFDKLDVQLQVRATDYNQFRDKVMKGNYQILAWGWHADYPDPENFLFLLYGPNGKVKAQGENASNYENPRFDELFERMENMEDSALRLRIIEEMTAIVREDAPWIWGFHPIGFGLYHEWYRNAKPMSISYGTMKYKRVDRELRRRRRKERNRPATWPLWLAFVILVAAAAPAAVRAHRRRPGEAGPREAGV